ncbi:MAG: hypothetical protein ACYCWW_20120, partial [Deltaproteobacteria bacterium]
MRAPAVTGKPAASPAHRGRKQVRSCRVVALALAPLFVAAGGCSSVAGRSGGGGVGASGAASAAGGASG